MWFVKIFGAGCFAKQWRIALRDALEKALKYDKPNGEPSVYVSFVNEIEDGYVSSENQGVVVVSLEGVRYSSKAQIEGVARKIISVFNSIQVDVNLPLSLRGIVVIHEFEHFSKFFAMEKAARP